MSTENEAVETVRAVLEANSPPVEDVQRASHQAAIQHQTADAEFVRLRDGRRSVLVRGSAKEIAEHDARLEAAERERDRWKAIGEELRIVRDAAERRARATQARKAAAELPQLVSELERIRVQARSATLALSNAYARAREDGELVDRDLRERIEGVLGAEGSGGTMLRAQALRGGSLRGGDG